MNPRPREPFAFALVWAILGLLAFAGGVTVTAMARAELFALSPTENRDYTMFGAPSDSIGVGWAFFKSLLMIPWGIAITACIVVFALTRRTRVKIFSTVALVAYAAGVVMIPFTIAASAALAQGYVASKVSGPGTPAFEPEVVILADTARWLLVAAPGLLAVLATWPRRGLTGTSAAGGIDQRAPFRRAARLCGYLSGACALWTLLAAVIAIVLANLEHTPHSLASPEDVGAIAYAVHIGIFGSWYAAILVLPLAIAAGILAARSHSTGKGSMK